MIQYIHFYLLFQALGRSLRQCLDKVTWWHFQITSKEVIWRKKIELHVWIKKFHFGNFSESAGMAMPC